MNTKPSKTKTVVLVGPTASGKTGLLDRVFGRGAFRICGDKTSGGSGPDTLDAAGNPETGMGAADGTLAGSGVFAEVISADSMQAYRGMDIGTAKAGPELRARLPHHLLDIRDPNEQYTAGEFVRLALCACAEIRARGGIPVVCGGTGFYVRNFICGVPTAPAADPEMRKTVASDLARLGIGRLRAELEASDPASAGRIHGNDIYRLTRALEIIRMTGKPLAEFAAGENARMDEEFLVLGIETPREELVRRIDLRVDAMFDSGLADEFRRLWERGCKATDPGMKAIGYREFFDPEKGSILDLHERKILDRIRELIKLDSRRYAKRQMTFFRALPKIVWISSEGDDFARLVRGFLSDDGGRISAL